LKMNIVRGTYPELVAFLVLNMWPSHLGLPLLLAVTILSKRVHRHPTFINLCVVFILIGISSSLLVYAGSVTGPEPSPVLCLLQASLLYGMPPMASIAVFALVVQMLLVIKANFNGVPLFISEKNSTVRLWVMIIAPYVAWMTFILATATVGALHPQNVSRGRRFFYCSLQSELLTDIITTVAAVFLLATFVLEGWTLALFYKHWNIVYGNEERPFELNMPIRVLAFGLYVVIAISLSLLSVTSPSSPVPDLVIAFAATAIMLIFGTQPDILRALCFWKKAPPILVKNEKAKVDINVIPSCDETRQLRWSHRNIPRI